MRQSRYKRAGFACKFTHGLLMQTLDGNSRYQVLIRFLDTLFNDPLDVFRFPAKGEISALNGLPADPVDNG